MGDQDNNNNIVSLTVDISDTGTAPCNILQCKFINNDKDVLADRAVGEFPIAVSLLPNVVLHVVHTVVLLSYRL